jgi:hypothetical protein
MKGVIRAIVPDAEWMIARYDVRHRWSLPFWYAFRAFELITKRART